MNDYNVFNVCPHCGIDIHEFPIDASGNEETCPACHNKYIIQVGWKILPLPIHVCEKCGKEIEKG